MNNQFATQFLLEDTEDEYSSLESALRELGTSEDAIKVLMNGVRAKHITPEGAIEIAKLTVRGVKEMSTTGGGTTAGASFTAGSGEQHAGPKAFKKVDEDAPRLAGSPAKTNVQGTKNLTAYKNFGFTKAPRSEDVEEKYTPEDSKKVTDYLKSLEQTNSRLYDKIKNYFLMAAIDPYPESYEDSLKKLGLGEDSAEKLNESRAYSKFKKETAIRSRDQQMHEAVKMIHRKLEEVSKLVEFAQQMKEELSEGDQTLEYKQNTKKVFEKINSKVVEVYSKTRNLK